MHLQNLTSPLSLPFHQKDTDGLEGHTSWIHKSCTIIFFGRTTSFNPSRTYVSHHTGPGYDSGNAELPGNVSPLTSLTQNISLDGTLNAFNVDTTNLTKVILQHPMAYKASLLDTYNGIQPLTNAKIDRTASYLQLEGVGKVCWSMFDSVGNVHDTSSCPHVMPLKHINACLLAWLSSAKTIPIVQLPSTLNHEKFNLIQINHRNMQLIFQLIIITTYQ